MLVGCHWRRRPILADLVRHGWPEWGNLHLFVRARLVLFRLDVDDDIASRGRDLVFAVDLHVIANQVGFNAPILDWSVAFDNVGRAIPGALRSGDDAFTVRCP